MKVWLKYLIGALFGAACALILPQGNQGVFSAMQFAAEIAVRFGCYMILPAIFFSAVVAFNQLRDTGLLLKAGLWTAGVIVASSLLLSVLGLLSILVARLPRIPITVDTVSEIPALNVAQMVRALFPYSAFETAADGTFILPAFFFAFLIGTASTADAAPFRPALQLMDSLSKLMYNISVFFTEFLSIGMAAILCGWTVEFRSTIFGGEFVPLILILLADLVIVAGAVYPLIVYYLCHDPHPYRILYASLCSVITAFFSGNSNLVLQLNVRHAKESLGIRRRINGAVHPLFTVFARGGSALVTAVGFIVIWRSYSSLSLPPLDVVWILLSSFGISFLLGGYPAGGAFVSLSVLCTLYGRGFETGFQLLKPAAPILCSFAAAFDALTAMFGSYIIAVKTKMAERHGISHFI